MWTGIFVVGIVMVHGTLWVLDGALPGGLVEGYSTMRHAQTMAFNDFGNVSAFQCFQRAFR
jgi:P-type Ca2+ transporter type 2C